MPGLDIAEILADLPSNVTLRNHIYIVETTDNNGLRTKTGVDSYANAVTLCEQLQVLGHTNITAKILATFDFN